MCVCFRVSRGWGQGGSWDGYGKGLGDITSIKVLTKVEVEGWVCVLNLNSTYDLGKNTGQIKEMTDLI